MNIPQKLLFALFVSNIGSLVLAQNDRVYGFDDYVAVNQAVARLHAIYDTAEHEAGWRTFFAESRSTDMADWPSILVANNLFEQAIGYHEMNKKDSALFYITEAMKKGIDINAHLRILDDSSYQYIANHITSTYDTLSVSYNKKVRKQLIQMHTLDQEVRAGTSWDSPTKEVLRTDSINQQKLKEITLKYGYPDFNEGGLDGDAGLIVLHARDSAYVAFMFDQIYQKTQKSNAGWGDLFTVYHKIIRYPYDKKYHYLFYLDLDSNGNFVSKDSAFFLMTFVSVIAQLPFPCNPVHNRLRALKNGGYIRNASELVYFTYPGEPMPSPAVVEKALSAVQKYCLSFGINPKDIRIAAQPVVALPACSQYYGCARIGFRDISTDE